MINKHVVCSSFIDYIDSLAYFSNQHPLHKSDLIVLNSGIQNPIFNYVYNNGAPSACIEDILRDFQQKKVPFYLCNGCSLKENHSVEPLDKFQFSNQILLDGMLFDLRNPISPLQSEGIEYVWVDSQEQLLNWLEVSAQTNGHTLEQGAQFFKTYLFENAKLLLAMSHRIPVGASMICIGKDGYAGNYWDSVIPQYQNRGIGSDMVKVRLNYAKLQGLHLVVAQCMDSSTRLYRKIGFEKVIDLEFYSIV